MHSCSSLNFSIQFMHRECNEPAKRKRLGRSGTFMAQWFRRWTLEFATRVRSPHGPLHWWYEALYEDRKDGKRSTVRAVETARPSSIEEDLKKIIKQIEVLQDRQDKQEQKFSRDNRNTSQGGPRRRNNGQLCFGCGAPDHFISVCPQRSSSGQQSRGNHAAAQSRSAGNFHPSN